MDRKQLSGAANNLSVDFLRECFDYRDGVLYWKERPLRHFQRAADHATFVQKRAGKPAGRRQADGYVNIGLRVNGRAISMSRHRVVWALHNGKWPDLHIDHINRRPGDDWIDNLREVTPAENVKNSARNRVFPYVGPNRSYAGTFAAQVRIGDRGVHIGVFDSEEEANAHRQAINVALEKLAREMAKKSKTGRKRKDHQTPIPSPMDSEREG